VAILLFGNNVVVQTPLGNDFDLISEIMKLMYKVWPVRLKNINMCQYANEG